MANEPVSPTPAPQRHIRTFAQDVARLSGKPLPSSAMKPVAAPQKAVVREPTAPLPQKKKPEPLPQPEPPKEPATPPPEPPPAKIVPKAPSTDESREAVLARLRSRTRKEEPLPAAAPAQVFPKAPSTNETREDVLARLKAKVASTATVDAVKLPEKPVTPPAPPPPPQKTQITKPLSKIPEGPDRIHTYKSDFVGQVTTANASKLSVLAAEADATPTNRVVLKEKKRFPTALVGGFLLILFGGGALSAAYFMISGTPTTVFVPRVPSIITFDETRELSGDPKTAFATAISEPLAEGRIRVVYISIATSTADGKSLNLPQTGGQLVQTLLPMPDILARSVLKESTPGILQGTDGQGAFVIISVDSFERSFAGMLAWEPRMPEDLAAFFPLHDISTTSSPTQFKDELVGNRDVRVLRDGEGRVILLYGYPDKETLILARDMAAYRTLIERLLTSRSR